MSWSCIIVFLNSNFHLIKYDAIILYQKGIPLNYNMINYVLFSDKIFDQVLFA